MKGKAVLNKIKRLDEEIERLEGEMNRASLEVERHFEKKPPDLPGRKYQRALKRWHGQLERKNARFECIKDEGLHKCEQVKELIKAYKEKFNEKYTVVIEGACPNFSAYLPDVPGCVATGRTVEEAKKNIADAFAMHLGKNHLFWGEADAREN